VPETPEQFWERTHGALRMPPLDEWATWPFDGDVSVRELAPPAETERTLHGTGGIDCSTCERGIDGALWHDDHWFVRPLGEPSGLPVVVLLFTRAHLNFPELDSERAAELGPLMHRIHDAVAAVPGVGNVHIGRWGEGSEHLHIWFMGRPARMRQLSDSFAAIWDDILPPLPEDVWRDNLGVVERELSVQ
jgi:diadenosine tetraphosphate (Ap4A) HIT family hydrolase